MSRLVTIAAAWCVACALAGPASAAKHFPIVGTPNADTIELLSVEKSASGNTIKSVKVRINGHTVSYVWETAYKKRQIKAGGGNDKITVSPSLKYKFVIFGEGGNDVIQGSDERDIIVGGPGRDEIKAGAGNDWVSGDSGNDTLWGGPGNDLIYGNAGNDVIRAGVGNDFVDGGPGNDVLWGEDGNDILHGEDGEDKARGGPGDDLVCGGLQADRLRGDAGQDILLGEEGHDQLEDSSRMSESDYEKRRKDMAKAIEHDFPVRVWQLGDRKWALRELTFLRAALKTFPNHVLATWAVTPAKPTYCRMRICPLDSLANSSLGPVGPVPVAILLHDALWNYDENLVKRKWVGAVTDETEHAYGISLP